MALYQLKTLHLCAAIAERKRPHLKKTGEVEEASNSDPLANAKNLAPFNYGTKRYFSS